MPVFSGDIDLESAQAEWRGGSARVPGRTGAAEARPAQIALPPVFRSPAEANPPAGQSKTGKVCGRDVA